MHFRLVQALAALLLLIIPHTYAFSEDYIFSSPLQKPIERTYKVILNTGLLSFMGIFVETKEEIITERIINLSLLYPFDPNEVELKSSGLSLDRDDSYLVRYYDTQELIAQAKNASSISDLYDAVREFNVNLARKGIGNCRISTSAFKIAFLNSPLANRSNDYKLMKAFVEDGYNAHRFIILSNKNGNFVIDPFWGKNKNMSDSVKTYSASFFDDTSAANFRGLVKKVDTFYG